ncbi:MAG: CDGSH iron-sulfur domain-containing protein [Candidatus Aenigmarchaeota archaeon]|nr:CDGSH iron-sulfur domain-containing protein [Candidatus Aenigmarchaeota archaeon]
MSKVTIKSMENGPSIVEVDGKAVQWLCRCGHSNKKPSCDGSHRKAEFKAPASETKVL